MISRGDSFYLLLLTYVQLVLTRFLISMATPQGASGRVSLGQGDPREGNSSCPLPDNGAWNLMSPTPHSLPALSSLEKVGKMPECASVDSHPSLTSPDPVNTAFPQRHEHWLKATADASNRSGPCGPGRHFCSFPLLSA